MTAHVNSSSRSSGWDDALEVIHMDLEAKQWMVTGWVMNANGVLLSGADLCVCSSEVEAQIVIAKIEACTVDGAVLIDDEVRHFDTYGSYPVTTGSSLPIAVASKADLERDPLPF